MSQKYFPFVIFGLLFILCLQIWKQDEFTKCVHPKMIQKVIQKDLHVEKRREKIFEEKNLSMFEQSEEAPVRLVENRPVWTVLIFSEQQNFRLANEQYYHLLKGQVHDNIIWESEISVLLINF